MSRTLTSQENVEDGWESDCTSARSISPRRSASPAQMFIAHETPMDRIRALKDIVDPVTRYHIKRITASTYSRTAAVINQIGRVAWVVATTGLVIAVPLAWELDKEGNTMFESEQDVQKRGRELLESNKERTPFGI